MSRTLDLFDQNLHEPELILEAYQNWLKVNEYSKITTRDYFSDAKLFLEFLQIPLSRLHDMHLVEYKEYLSDKLKLKPTSINKKLAGLKNFCEWLFEHNYIYKQIKPAKQIKIQKSPVAPKALTDKEQERLMQFVASSNAKVVARNKAIFKLMLKTGIRVGELVNLNHGHIEINDRSGYMHIVQGKGAKARTVLIGKSARDALSTYIEYRNKKYNWHPKPDDPLFVSERGDKTQRISVRAVQSIIKNIVDKANIERLEITAHTFRHTFATNYYDKHRDVVGLSKMLGHSSLDTTSIYTEASEEQMLMRLDSL